MSSHRPHYCLLALAVVLGIVPGRAEEPLSYDRDIRPILSENCFFCHGPDASKREADLRLDDEQAAKAGAIVPGMPDTSPLITRIFSQDADEQMPPPTSKLTLTVAEKQRLRKWIEQGAGYAQHWAMVAPRNEIPLTSVADASWCRNEVDRFVLAGLEAAGLAPSPTANRETLIRRLTLDLHGLPPTLEEIDAFVQDDRPEAYEALVDRLLSHEHYGERLAIEWLDVARYADTYGYQADRYRAMWPWRDWVVKAFNQNLPYDRFIVWQLAGDLLPKPTREQVMATAFNRNHRQTNEGGSVEEEFRNEYVADRVNTFGAAFLGMTLECCRCHDHKYDPISQRDYYQLAAFFNSIDESGLYSHFTEATPTPALLLDDERQAAELASLRQQLAAAEVELRELVSQAGTRFEQWSKTNLENPTATGLVERIGEATKANLIADLDFESLEGGKLINRVQPDKPASSSDNPEIVAGKVGHGLKLSGENNVTFKPGGEFTRDTPFSIALWLNAPQVFERAVVFHRSRAWTDSGSRGYELLIEDGKLSVGLIHFYPGNAIRVVAKEPLVVGQWSHVTVTYDGSSRASGVQLYVNGRLVPVDVVRDCLTKNIHDDVKDVAIGQRFRDVGFKGGLVDEFKVFDRDLTALEIERLVSLESGLAFEPREADRALWQQFYLATSEPEISSAKAKIRALRESISKLHDPIPEIMVMQETTPRATYVLTRGAYDAPGEQVQRGTPTSFLPMQADWPRNRLGLAYWLVDAQHPLTARVTVNRFWQMLYGRGLVTTPEDFGLQGAPPTHPELLDWLARRLIDSGWNVKALLKTIVMSATYQQRSDPTPHLIAQDPENRWLARGPVHRLPAEMIRDLALATSGLLVDKLGGPPVKPYQPEGLWEEKSGEKYQRDVGEGSHRRSLYTFWKRTSPPPSMMSFDATSREVCTVRRQATLTPLQVLVLLNDPQYVEAGRGLAERCLKATKDPEQQLIMMFRLLTGRHPNNKELSILERLRAEQRDEFLRDPERAKSLLKIGDHQFDPMCDPEELAALNVVAVGLLSYDETVMKR